MKQVKESESQEGKEQPMGTPSDEANRVEQIELVENEHVIEGSVDVPSAKEEIGQVSFLITSMDFERNRGKVHKQSSSSAHLYLI